MKFTDWFPGSAKPVRKGVYQRVYTYGMAKIPSYCYWDGKQWHAGGLTVDAAVRNYEDAFMVAPRQCLPWRGVLK
jgi:hypothetical protein